MRTWLQAIPLLLLTVAAAAQTPTAIPITGNLGTITGAPAPDSYALITLVNCAGGNPQITGFQGIVQTSYRFVADTNGDINGTIWPNDLISCSGTTGATLYSREIVSDDVPVGQTQCYQIVHTQGVWNLNTQQPVACGVTPPDPQDATYNNLVVNLNIQTNTLEVAGQTTLTGMLVANGGITLPAIQDCPSGQWMSGLSATLAPQCAAVSTGVLSFNGRTGTVVPATGDYSYAQISGTPTLHYQTLQGNGVGLAQEPLANYSSRFALTDNAGIGTNIDLALSGATAGTYTNPSVTVNAYGLVTAISTGAGAGTMQIATKTGGCLTGASSYDVCSDTLTWPLAFTDTTYAAVCFGIGPSDARAVVHAATTKTTTTITAETVTEGSVAVSFSEIDCIGVHS